MTGWLWLHSHSHGALLLRWLCSACCTDSPEKSGHSSPASAVRDLKNLYGCDIPDSMIDRDLLLSHFQQFGRVLRIYLSLKRKSCTVHFDSHVSMFVHGSNLLRKQRICWHWSVWFCIFLTVQSWKYKFAFLRYHRIELWLMDQGIMPRTWDGCQTYQFCVVQAQENLLCFLARLRASGGLLR